MTLVDTSVWIAAFRRAIPLRLEEVVEFEEIVTCLPIVQEVLQGFRDESAWRRARKSMLALPIVESPWRSCCSWRLRHSTDPLGGAASRCDLRRTA